MICYFLCGNSSKEAEKNEKEKKKKKKNGLLRGCLLGPRPCRSDIFPFPELDVRLGQEDHLGGLLVHKQILDLEPLLVGLIEKEKKKKRKLIDSDF